MAKNNKLYSIDGELVNLLIHSISSLTNYLKNTSFIEVEDKIFYLDSANDILNTLKNLDEVGDNNLDISNAKNFLNKLDNLLTNNKIKG